MWAALANVCALRFLLPLASRAPRDAIVRKHSPTLAVIFMHSSSERSVKAGFVYVSECKQDQTLKTKSKTKTKGTWRI